MANVEMLVMSKSSHEIISGENDLAQYSSSRKLRHEAIWDLLNARLSLKETSEYINSTTREQ
ncbi:hypothetical protein [Photobacterium iliopiscarium]|jgi:hypothetical protein|uniref:hypothetical protein n=1 Tax=Photobacterium iliopiscarium TaxID=56192 RepID=UPI002433289D|nr:hypothetical protein [Photobacterium iliopiscarium]